MPNHAILNCIQPVLDELTPSFVTTQLRQHIPTQQHYFAQIEQCFLGLTRERHSEEILRRFFHSWSQTNNSAMTVSGLSNRLSKIKHDGRAIHDEPRLLSAIASLNRIADEDLAVVGSVLHSELFYTMASTISGDDQWQSRRYLSEQAEEFKRWKDYQSLRVKDPVIGLLTTLVHEIYTHGEVEYILPLFTQLLEQHFDFEPFQRNRTLAWIKVHCGGTELQHFLHAVSAVEHYCAAMNVDITEYDIAAIIGGYVQRKAEVMNRLSEAFPNQVMPNAAKSEPAVAIS